MYSLSSFFVFLCSLAFLNTILVFFIIITIMELKRNWTSDRSSDPSYVSNILSFQVQEEMFLRNFDAKNLTLTHFVGESFNDNFKIFNAFVQANLKKFISNKPKYMFLELTKVFFAHLRYKGGTIRNGVYKQEITLFMEHFSTICDLCCPNFLYKPEVPKFFKDFDYPFSYQYLLSNSNEGHNFPSPLDMCIQKCFSLIICWPVFLSKENLILGRSEKNDVI